MTLPNEEDGEEDEGGILLDEVDPVLRTPSIVRKLRTTTRCAFPYESTFCFLNLPIFQVALDQICESFQLDPLLQLTAALVLSYPNAIDDTVDYGVQTTRHDD